MRRSSSGSAFRAICPDGLPFEYGRIGTATTCFAFKWLSEIQNGDSSLASPSLPSWNRVLAFLKEFDRLRQNGGFAIY
jgi:hypothetical protein